MEEESQASSGAARPEDPFADQRALPVVSKRPLPPLPRQPRPPVPVYSWNVTVVGGRTAVRGYAPKLQLSQKETTVFADEEVDEIKRKFRNDHGLVALVLAIIKTPGVSEVTVYPYEVRVSIGLAFDPEGDGIDEAVLAALTEYAGAELSALQLQV